MPHDPAPPRIGYPLPTCDRTACDDDEVWPLVDLARRAGALGSHPDRAGDSPLARPPTATGYADGWAAVHAAAAGAGRAGAARPDGGMR